MATYEELLCQFFSQLKREHKRHYEEPYEDRLKKFFKDLASSYKTIKATTLPKNNMLALNFNLVELIDPDDRKISDLLALLLNPKETHAQEEKFLEKFLEQIKKSLMKTPELIDGIIYEKLTEKTDLMESIIIKKLPIDSKKSIDLAVMLPNGLVIAIENNLSMEHQKDQLKDYDSFLNETNSRHYLLIYLDAWGRESKSIDIKRKLKLKAHGKLIEVSYQRFLKPWLRECFKVCKADKVRWFLRDFIAWIERRFPEESFKDFKTVK